MLKARREFLKTLALGVPAFLLFPPYLSKKKPMGGVVDPGLYLLRIDHDGVYQYYTNKSITKSRGGNFVPLNSEQIKPN